MYLLRNWVESAKSATRPVIPFDPKSIPNVLSSGAQQVEKFRRRNVRRNLLKELKKEIRSSRVLRADRGARDRLFRQIKDQLYDWEFFGAVDSFANTGSSAALDRVRSHLDVKLSTGEVGAPHDVVIDEVLSILESRLGRAQRTPEAAVDIQAGREREQLTRVTENTEEILEELHQQAQARRNRPGPAMELDSEIPFGYDLRRGAAGYAPIVGAIAGFVVTGLVLLFDLASRHAAGQSAWTVALLGRASALLVLGLIACLFAAFSLAAIGAETRLTPNLTAATLYVGMCTAIGIVAIIAAFEVLATIYLPDTHDLFAWATGGVAVAGSVLVAFVFGDAWRTPDLSEDHWLYGSARSARWAIGAVIAGVSILGCAMALYSSNVRIGTGNNGLHLIIGAGIFLALLSGVAGIFRSMHRDDGEGREIKKYEAIIVVGLMNVYLAVFLLLMP
jgi:hypothetical protein